MEKFVSNFSKMPRAAVTSLGKRAESPSALARTHAYWREEPARICQSSIATGACSSSRASLAPTTFSFRPATPTPGSSIRPRTGSTTSWSSLSPKGSCAPRTASCPTCFRYSPSQPSISTAWAPARASCARPRNSMLPTSLDISGWSFSRASTSARTSPSSTASRSGGGMRSAIRPTAACSTTGWCSGTSGRTSKIIAADGSGSISAAIRASSTSRPSAAASSRRT